MTTAMGPVVPELCSLRMQKELLLHVSRSGGFYPCDSMFLFVFKPRFVCWLALCSSLIRWERHWWFQAPVSFALFLLFF